MVFVTDSITVSDPDKLVSLLKEAETSAKEAGATELKVYKSVNNPNKVMMTALWPSHDALHQYEEKMGDEFNDKISDIKQGEWDEDAWQEV